MNRVVTAWLCLLPALLPVSAARAATAYITDSIQVGLHQEKTTDSPVTATLPSNTTVEIIKQEQDLSYVQGPDGVAGWVDNSYLKTGKPAAAAGGVSQAQYRQLETQLAQANQRLKELEAGAGSGATGDRQLQEENEKLQQQYHDEQLKSGELQVQVTELRNRIGQNNDNQSLYQQIQALEERNKELEVRLASGGPGQAAADGADRTRQGIGPNWQRDLAYLGVALVAGLCLGIYFMDYLNRRRHGGFRI